MQIHFKTRKAARDLRARLVSAGTVAAVIDNGKTAKSRYSVSIQRKGK
jgi:hypothetical protein